MLPGVNGASATALKAVAQDIAGNQAHLRQSETKRQRCYASESQCPAGRISQVC